MDYTDIDRLEGLTPEIVQTIKEYLCVLEETDFSMLSRSELMDIQRLVNELRFFMPVILMELPFTTDIVRVTKNPRSDDGRRTRRIHSLSRLKYPPRELTTIGRANFPKRSVLYGSFFGLTSTVESRVQAGDLITRSEWRMVTYVEKIRYTIIHNDQDILKNLPYFEEFSHGYKTMLSSREPLEAELMETVNRFVARQFRKTVDAEKPVNYLISAFVGDLLLYQNNLDAIIYPSVQLQEMDVCVAMRAEVFDEMFTRFESPNK